MTKLSLLKGQSLRLSAMVVGVVSSMMIAFTFTPAFASFAASIQNTVNTAATGSLAMQEVSGAITCNSTDANTTNTAICATINKYGGTGTALLAGGTANTTNISIKNTGSVPATSFTLAPGLCSQSAAVGASFTGGATDLCTKLNVTIKSGVTTIFTGTAASLAAGGTVNLLTPLAIPSVAAGATIPLTFTVGLDASAGSTYQGLQAAQALTWAFGA